MSSVKWWLKLVVYEALSYCKLLLLHEPSIHINVYCRMKMHAEVCLRMLTYADVCRRMPTYADDVCWRMLWLQEPAVRINVTDASVPPAKRNSSLGKRNSSGGSKGPSGAKWLYVIVSHSLVTLAQDLIHYLLNASMYIVIVLYSCNSSISSAAS